MRKVKLLPHQVEAFEIAKHFEGFLLIPEQRSGKTLITLKLVEYHKPDRLLILGPKNAMPVWDRAIKRWLEITWGIQIKLVYYGKRFWNRRVSLAKWMEDSRNGMIVVDEAHMIKSRGSKAGKASRMIAFKKATKGAPKRARAKIRLGLTGTPIAQGIQDAWALFDFIDPPVFGTFEKFASRYLEYGGFKNKQIVGPKNLEEFNEIFHGHSYRITLREAQKKAHRKMLVRRYVRIPVELPRHVMRLYQDIERGFDVAVNGRKIKIPLVANIANKLQQISGGFIYDGMKNVMSLHREKLNALRKLLEGPLAERKAVIAVQFIPEFRAVAELAESLGRSYTLIGDGNTFQDETLETNLAILQIKSGASYDLSAADDMIFYSWDYSHPNHDQAKFRIVSFPKRFVSYYYLIAGRVDELLYLAVTRKMNFAKLVCDEYRR